MSWFSITDEVPDSEEERIAKEVIPHIKDGKVVIISEAAPASGARVAGLAGRLLQCRIEVKGVLGGLAIWSEEFRK